MTTIGEKIAVEKNVAGDRTSYTANLRGDQTEVQNTRGYRTTSVYDAAGLSIASAKKLGDCLSDCMEGKPIPDPYKLAEEYERH